VEQDIEVKASGVTANHERDFTNSFDALMDAFEAYKETNDRRLTEIEHCKNADPLLNEQLKRIDHALNEQQRHIDSLITRASRPALSGEIASQDSLQHKTAFDAYVRKGDEYHLRCLEEKSQAISVSEEGGYLVPNELDHELSRRMIALSPIRSISSVRQVSGPTYQKAFSVSGPSAGWVAETDARAESTKMNLQQRSFVAAELYAMPVASSILLDDAAVDIEQWLLEEIESVFAEKEGTAFVNGTGTHQPKGFLTCDKTTNDTWEWGKLGYIATGVEGGFADNSPSDKLVDLIYSLKAGYRQNAVWVMSRSTQAEIRKFKDNTGNYLWQPPAAPGGRASLMNFPLIEVEDMPAPAENSFSIAFGDFRRGYLIVDRQGLRVLRDPFSAKPHVLFYTTKRVGGGIHDFDAIKLLKCGVT